MIPGMNPRMMKQAMKRMGMSQQDIEADEVIIKCQDKEIVITNPSVQKVLMMGQESFQISGEVEEKEIDSTPEINEEDLSTVCEQTGVTKEEARAAILENNGDLALTIMKLKEA